MFKKIRNKKGGTELLQVILLLPLMTFIIFFPLATFSLNQRENLVEDTKILGLQMAARQGGVTPAVQGALKNDLKSKGFDISKTVINTNADGSVSKPLIKRDDSTQIIIELYVPAKGDVTFLKILWGFVGLKPGASGYAFGGPSSNYYYYTRGYVLSEKP